jgi:UDP-N-acetylmuramyl pentapeptide phosphotransferase/UDP-N-acetylglucosamine-1-phosphate transferase
MAVYAPWLGPFGWGIFFIAFIVAIILFAVKRKFYPIMYLISIATYIFTLGFVIDAFDLSKNFILLLLALSAILFILAGVYFAKKFEKHKQKFMQSAPKKK